MMDDPEADRLPGARFLAECLEAADEEALERTARAVLEVATSHCPGTEVNTDSSAPGQSGQPARCTSRR